MANFGTVTFNGIEYNLTSQADFTGRQLDGRYTNYNDASEGETYDVEFSANGTDVEGNEITAYWMFQFEKGNEPELDDLNWDNADRVVSVK